MGGSNILLQKLSSNVIIYGFIILVITLIIYTFVTREGIIPVNLIYEKKQKIDIILPQTNDKINIKYHKAVEGKSYLKLVNTVASLENNTDSYNINAKVVLTNSQGFSRFDKLPTMIFPSITISNIHDDVIQSGFTLLKNNFLFFGNTAIKKQNDINIFSIYGKKMRANIYLSGVKINIQNYRILSYEKVIYSKKSLHARNVFIRINTAHNQYNGTAKTLNLRLSDKKNYIGKATKISLKSSFSNAFGNLLYFEQQDKDAKIYILNGFNFESESFSIKTFYPVFLSFNPEDTGIFFYSKNIITGKNLNIEGNNIKVKIGKKKVIISSNIPLKISLQKGIVFGKKIVLNTEQPKYKMVGVVTGLLYGVDENVELKGDNLNIKETSHALKLYSYNPIIFKTKENVIKAKKVLYDKAIKKFTFSSDVSFVCVNKLTSPRIRIFSEKLTIQKDSSIILSNKFKAVFLEKSIFKSFAGFGITSISKSVISMVGKINTKIAALQPISYISRRQYINLDNKGMNGFSRDNVFFYNNSKFFADTFNIKKSSATICHRYGITITYIYNTKISTKCIKYYFANEKLVLPQGKITK